MQPNSNPIPDLSVVVIGRNEGSRLERCLRSIREMEFDGIVEVIYVDSASTDNSVETAESFGAHVLSVRPVRPTAALGRNAGWKLAKAPFILFLDGDTILHKRFVAESLPEFADPNVAIVWGHRREIDTAASIYNRVLDLDWVYQAGFTDFCGGDALVRRSILQSVNGFDEALIAGEEPEMCRRIRATGLNILHVDRPMTGHDLAMTKWQQYWKRATRAGYAYAEVSARFQDSGMPFWKEEVQRTRNRAIILTAIPLLGLTLSVAFRSVVPTCAAIAFLALLVLRTSLKARWKSPNRVTCILYAIHSHVQQVPIFAGQRQFLRDRRRGRSRGIIEYKKAAS